MIPYDEIAKILTGSEFASAWDEVGWADALVRELNIPSLSAHGMTESHIPEVVQKTLNAGSYKGNPIPLGENELREIMEKAI